MATIITDWSSTNSDYSGTWSDDVDSICGVMSYSAYSITYDSIEYTFADKDDYDSTIQEYMDAIAFDTQTVTLSPLTLTADLDLTYTVIGYFTDYVTDFSDSDTYYDYYQT